MKAEGNQSHLKGSVGYFSTIKVLLVVLVLTLPAVLRAQFTFTTNNGAITITGYNGDGGAVSIPESVNGMPVTSIGAYAFNINTTINSVAIPGSITNIGFSAFRSCSNLGAIAVDTGNLYYSSLDGALLDKFQTQIIQFPAAKTGSFTIPTGVTSISFDAFMDALNLTNVTIPNTVTNIGAQAFRNCRNLTSITVPAGVNAIKSFTFMGCRNLTNVAIPDSVTHIAGYAFADCSSLTNIGIPFAVSNIASVAFGSCSNLITISVDLLNSFYSSLDGVLFNKNQTKLVQFPGGKAGGYLIPASVASIEPAAFYGAAYLTNVTIPDGVAHIGDSAFYSCKNLADVALPNSITNIGGSAFGVCHSLSSIVIPSGITAIGGQTFWRCTNLTNISIPSGVTGIGDWAFLGCRNLTSLSLPPNLTQIGLSAFSGCASITNIFLPNAVTNIGESAFEGCTRLTTIFVDPLNSFYSDLEGVLFNRDQTTLIQYPNGKTGGYAIPSSVKTIGNFAFSFNAHLTSITIPNSVTNIGRLAFAFCTSLTTLTIPYSVSSMGDFVFGACPSLTAITVDAASSFFSSLDGVLFDLSQSTLIQYPPARTGNYVVPNGVSSIGGGAFHSSLDLTHITVPNTVTNIGREAFAHCINLSSITIPSSVTSIGYAAFLFSTNLTGVYFKGNAPSIDWVFSGDNATIYYLPGSTGWGATFGDRPTKLWNARVQTTDTSFGIRTNQFGFNVNWASGMTVAVDACADLANPTWTPLQTNTLTADTQYFSDPNWTNYPARFYRLRWP